MAIHVDRENRVFTIHTAHSTYQFMAGPYGFLLHLYYGKRIDHQSLEYLIQRKDWASFSSNPGDAGGDRTFSLDTLPLEYPTAGTGDCRISAAAALDEDGAAALDPRYKDFEIRRGKYALPGLPALYEAEPGEAETLAVVLEDPVSRLELELLYGVFAEKDIITRAVVFTNRSGKNLRLTRALSAGVDFLYGDFDLVHFHGRHMMERQIARVPAAPGIQTVSSARGTSSHQHNPGVILCEKDAGEDYGDCYGFNLVYSGSFAAQVEQDQTGQTRLVMGVDYGGFTFLLAGGERFTTPELVMCHSGGGFAALSHRYHRIYRHNLCRGDWKLARRPVLINNWEATYFRFDGPKLIQIAEAAAGLGLDLLVMDDGWFGARDDDNRGLGDWFPNEEKLGMSLGTLVEEVNKRGLKFGIWFEPEMVNEESGLYRAHPDWVLRLPGRDPVRGRGQLALDMSRQDTRDYLFERISAVLDSARVEYVKWDMNRSLSDWYSPLLPADRQGELPHRYVLGLYDLLERLTRKYPRVLFEGCSGGGGRFDPGMLFYHPQIWCSDNTDAIDRLKIQYGTSFFYPVSAVGSHVSVVPNHGTGRTTPLATRCIAAMAGTFGFEMDLTRMDDAERAEAARWTAEFKKYQPLIHGGAYYRLLSPFERRGAPGNAGVTAWEFVSPDKTQALLCAAAGEIRANPLNIHIRLKGLDENRLYRLGEALYTGAALMYGGFALPGFRGDYPARVFFFEGA
ncbi:MAG: alpha-galactosidase [Treponema sp.]|jgi:alpha-galactosidase|nr:alpha-galactosidase [Treponema sp.]